MNSVQNNKHAVHDVIAILSPHQPLAALWVLQEAFRHTLSRLTEQNRVISSDHATRRVFIKRRLRSRIDLDPEIKEFILSLTEPITITELRDELTARFGAERTPSKSSVHRYLKKLEMGL